MEQQSVYEGSIDAMPGWAKNQVLPRWKRFLINQQTLYFVTLIGLAIIYSSDHWYYTVLNAPCWFLLMELAGITHRSHWLEACLKSQREHKEKDKPEKPLGPIPSPFMRRL